MTRRKQEPKKSGDEQKPAERRTKKAATPRAKKKARKKQDPHLAGPPAELESMLRSFSTLFSDRDAYDSSLSRAQELMYRAAETDDWRKQVALARQALQISPDCADAYLLLADAEETADDALLLIERAVEAGRRAIGDEFDELIGHFWGFLQTRPYMRARLTLANCLWQMGRDNEAVQHYQELLRLNPNDNQGVRHLLLTSLLALNRDDEAEALIERYHEDGSAHWVYSRVLLAFRKDRDAPTARELLAVARKANPHVVQYLLGKKRLPARLPAYISFGDTSEAIAYAADSLENWKSTPGAITWLRESLGSKGRTSTKRPRASRASAPESLPELAALPQKPGEIWEVGSQPLTARVREGNRVHRTWMVLVINTTQDLVLLADMLTAAPDAETLRQAVVQAISAPAIGAPHRPGMIQVRSGDDQVALAPLLQPLGIDCEVSPELEFITAAMAGFESHFGPTSPLSALMEVPGMTTEQVGEFFEAAAAFYRHRPWRRVPGDTVIQVDCTALDHGPWYAVVMGQSGIELGFALYDDLRFLRKLLAGRASDRKSAEATAAYSVTYCEEFEVPPADLDAAEQFGWPVATPEAWPMAMRVDPGPKLRSPEPWELGLLTDCLNAIPEFLERKTERDGAMESPQHGIALSWAEL